MESKEGKIIDKKTREGKLRFFEKHPVLKAFLQGFLFFLIFFATGEIGLRYMVAKTRTLPKHEGGTEFKPHPVLFWRLRPKLNMIIRMPKGGEFRVITNKYGIRNDDIPFKKPPNGYRIECYGDSITYGHGVNKEDTYEYQLQEILRKKHPDKKIDVINFGCPGYTSFQGWYLFNKLGKKYEPDLCILAFCYADPSAEEMSDSERAPKNPVIRTIQEFLYNSELYLALRQMKIKSVDMYGKKKDLVKLTSVRVSEEEYRKIMTAWAEEMKKRGGHVIYLGLPMSRPDPFPYYKNYREICKDVAKKTGNYYLDLNAIFHQSTSDIDSLFLLSVAPNETVDRIHPNAKGFKIMAEAIADLIEKAHLISPQ